MVGEYEYKLVSKTQVIDTDPYQDENGDWVFPEDNPIQDVIQQCRAEANTTPAKVPGKDGVKVDYSFMIYLPVDAIELPAESDVIIRDHTDKEIGKGTVKRFYRGTMNCRIWV